MKNRMNIVVPAVAIALTLVLGPGCSKTEQQEVKAEQAAKKEQKKAAEEAAFRDDEWNDAVKSAQKGYEQLAALDENLSEMEPRRAKRHLDKAVRSFRNALAHLEKSEVGKPRQSAIGGLSSGVDKLDKAYAELDEGRVDAAQAQLDKASRPLARAEKTLQ